MTVSWLLPGPGAIGTRCCCFNANGGPRKSLSLDTSEWSTGLLVGCILRSRIRIVVDRMNVAVVLTVVEVVLIVTSVSGDMQRLVWSLR